MSYEEMKELIEDWLSSGELHDEQWIVTLTECLHLIKEKLIDNNEDMI